MMAQKTKGPVSFLEAVRILKAGGVAALPTETVYGLAASIYSEKALRRVFQLKKRPLFDPLIVHCLNAEQAESLTSGGIFPAQRLWRRFAPGPLTLVLPKNNKVSPLVTGGLETVALRIPSHPLMRRVLKAAGVPLAAPSANQFSKTSPACAAHVLSAFKGKVPVLDGGAAAIGIESTIVQPDPRKKQLVILRPGAVTAAALKRFLYRFDLKFPAQTIGKSREFSDKISIREKAGSWSVVRLKEEREYKEASGPMKKAAGQRAFPACPGSFKRHYAPPAELVIAEGDFLSKAALKARLKALYPGRAVRFLSLPRSSYEAARRLYHDMRLLSGEDPGSVVICAQKKLAARKKYQTGCWPAVWDRLRKASSRCLRFPP